MQPEQLTRSDTVTAAEAFARLRQEFHALLEQPSELRERALRELGASDPTMAAELRVLLESVPKESPVDRVSGTAFGPFIAAEELGRGGMAVVYRGYREDAGFTQTVALKLLHPGTRSSAGQQRFLRERQILARLEHPNIARLIDAGMIADGRLWLAMEYIAGADLHAACRARKLSVSARVQLLADVGDAVAYAHSRLVLHRDLKPANILVGDDNRPRLLDFGIARLLDETDPGLTATGFQALTPRYAAPEQLRGEAVSTASDIYALGAIVHELCLEGQPKGDSVLRAVVERACAPQPADRYSSAAALTEDLRDWLAGRNLRSGIGSRRARSWRWIRLYRWPLGTALAVSLALTLGGVATWHQANRAAKEAQLTRSHLNALLEVLGAASPQIYAGRDPPASAFLIEAAQRLRAQADVDPELLWLSLNQIGNGLINLGHYADGRSVLEAALAALDRATSMPASLRLQRRLDNLRLLALTLNKGSDRLLLHQLGKQILATSAAADAPAEAALGTLAVAAGACAKLGEFQLGQRLLDLATTLEPRAHLGPEQTESYWRQRGWLALRARQLDPAAAAFGRALGAVEAAPERFSAMRRAEAQWLLAALALQNEDAVAAARWLEQAAPVYASEYRADHSELAVFHLMLGYQALLDAQPRAAMDWLELAIPILLRDPAAADDLQSARWFYAAALAQTGDCPAARSQTEMALAIATDTTQLPNRSHLIERARNWLRADCGENGSAQGP